MKDGNCPKCDSTDVIPGVTIPDHFNMTHAMHLSLKVSENPGAFLFKGTKSSKLRAYVCGSCGYSELYVDDPRLLWEVYEKRSKRQQ